jgi:hypothetical protein
VDALKGEHPCLNNPELARQIVRLWTTANPPSSQEESDTWAKNSLGLSVTEKFWGKNGKDNYGKPRLEYMQKLEKMTDEELEKESDQKMWLSAFANNNPRSDFHWHVDLIYDEWYARGKGHRYGEIHTALTKRLGH